MRWFVLLLGVFLLSTTCRAEEEQSEFSLALRQTPLVSPNTIVAFEELARLDPESADEVAKFWYYKNRAKNLELLEKLEKRVTSEADYEGKSKDLRTLWVVFRSFLFDHRKDVEEMIQESVRATKASPQVREHHKKLKEEREQWFKENGSKRP